MANLLLTGVPRFSAHSGWRPLPAVLAAVTAQVALQLCGGLAGAYVGDMGLLPGLAADKQLWLTVIVFLALSQVGVLAFAWWAAGLFGAERRAVLQLHRGAPGFGDILIALAGLALVLGGYNALVYAIRPDLLMADAAPFRPMLESPLWPATVLAIGIGAPLSEEFLFRGFLLSALARRRGGFWPAALLVNIIWTGLHLGYSIVGLMEVFIGGLYLSWLLWRTGNLWLPIIAHAATNIFFLAVIAVYPFA